VRGKKAHVIFRQGEVVAVCLDGKEKAAGIMNRLRDEDRKHFNSEHGLTDHPGLWEKWCKTRPYNEHIFWHVVEADIV